MTLLQSNQVAQALKVDEKTVARWIKKDGLPAVEADGGYRVDPVDLLEWATERNIKVDPSLYRMRDDDTRPLPSLSQALEAGGIHEGIEAGDKKAALREVLGRFDLAAEDDRELILEMLLAREAIGSTAVGDGIAIPHLRNPLPVHSPRAKVSLCFLARPVEFDAPDGKPVRILFTILSSDIRAHLHLLSEIAFCLKDPRLRQLLDKKCDPVAVMSAVREIERDIASKEAKKGA